MSENNNHIFFSFPSRVQRMMHLICQLQVS